MCEIYECNNFWREASASVVEVSGEAVFLPPFLFPAQAGNRRIKHEAKPLPVQV